MEFENVIYGESIKKTYRGFTLNIPELKIPKGFATALIGENGAGKSTLIDIMTGIKLDHQGTLTYFGKYTEQDRENNPVVKNKIGYTGTGSYYLPSWTTTQVEKVQQLLFDDFDLEKYHKICSDLDIFTVGKFTKGKKVSSLSDGNRTKMMIAGVLSRNTDLLILDEPASPLDPLMRDRLCEILREYLNESEGEKSIVFSTHNIADMESVTDYAIIVEHGEIVEQGFVEDLKDKYIVVKGDKADEAAAKGVLYSLTSNSLGFEGLCLTERIDELAGLDLVKETPTLSQIVLAVMRKNTKLKY